VSVSANPHQKIYGLPTLLRVDTCTGLLPEHKPRYVMGIVRGTCASSSPPYADNLQGYPEDLVVAMALGADMFDCVWPTRTAVCFEPSDGVDFSSC